MIYNVSLKRMNSKYKDVRFELMIVALIFNDCFRNIKPNELFLVQASAPRLV